MSQRQFVVICVFSYNSREIVNILMCTKRVYTSVYVKSVSLQYLSLVSQVSSRSIRCEVTVKCGRVERSW